MAVIGGRADEDAVVFQKVINFYFFYSFNINLYPTLFDSFFDQFCHLLGIAGAGIVGDQDIRHKYQLLIQILHLDKLGVNVLYLYCSMPNEE